jgi:hypothetical protein
VRSALTPRDDDGEQVRDIHLAVSIEVGGTVARGLALTPRGEDREKIADIDGAVEIDVAIAGDDTDDGGTFSGFVADPEVARGVEFQTADLLVADR